MERLKSVKKKRRVCSTGSRDNAPKSQAYSCHQDNSHHQGNSSQGNSYQANCYQANFSQAGNTQPRAP